MIEERDITVVVRDGTRLVLDVYRPDATGRYPVLYACSLHNKDIQGPDIADVLPPQPAHAPLWFGPIEAGNTRHFIANGYVHVIAQPRGSAKSEGVYGHEDTDHYDLIEWITRQSWCDGNVGMVGISGYAGEQWRAAAQGHPALKAIFPYDACSAYGGMFGFRDFAPGGVLHTFPYLLDVFSTVHESRDRPTELPPEQEELWHEAMHNADFKQYINLYNILTQKGQRTFLMYHLLTSPWEADGTAEQSEEAFKKIKIPFYTGSGAYAYTYKLHWLGAQHYFQNIEQPKKLIFTGPATWSALFISITTRSSVGTTIGLKVGTPASWTSRRSAIGSWVPTRGVLRATGRCRRPNGRNSTCPNGRGLQRIRRSDQRPGPRCGNLTSSPKCRSHER
jgi:uncharacterized protein